MGFLKNNVHFPQLNEIGVQTFLSLNASTAEVNLSFFSTKSPQLKKKNGCYLRKLVTILYLSLTQALLSVFGRFFCSQKKKKERKKTIFKDYRGRISSNWSDGDNMVI